MAVLDYQGSQIPTDAAAVDISSVDHACKKLCIGIYVGVAGDVILDGQNTTGVVFTAVPAGVIIPGRWVTVVKASTTATNMAELYVA